MSAVDVDALDKLREVATPGPWAEWNSAVVNPATPARDVFVECDHPADAALIVAAVNALPDILAEVRRGRALREAVEGLAEELDEKPHTVSPIVPRVDISRRLRAALAPLDPS